MAPTQYTHWDVLLASPTAPMPEAKRLHQLMMMWMGLAAMEQGKEPTPNDWRVVSDAVNLLETFVIQGTATDDSGLLMDAITALALSGKRHLKGGSLRLDGPGMAAVRAVLEDYAALLDVLPARTVIQCHRATETRLRQIYAGKSQKHDIEIIGI
ncbi:MAG: hypothetical protein JJD98_00310 [Polaromonas sp.]|nr:hypothetical protein [Polaromonas sp.]